ncbi:hypothetical protein IG631_10569 [Alternaria alternata]|nr:hypothetical protein IG631_10569 [Alternaria alternata]
MALMLGQMLKDNMTTKLGSLIIPLVSPSMFNAHVPCRGTEEDIRSECRLNYGPDPLASIRTNYATPLFNAASPGAF